MSSNMMAPRPQEKPKMTATSSPSFSQLGRSPSIGGPPGYTTDDIIAAQNLRCARWLHILRISINAFTLAASIAVVACAASSLRSYSQSHVDPEWLLPLWPLHVDLRPSHAVLACGIIVAIFSLAYMAVAFVPLVSRTSSIFQALLIAYPLAAKATPSQPRVDHFVLPCAFRHTLHHRLRLRHHQQPCLQHGFRHTQLLDLQMAGFRRHRACKFHGYL